MQKKSLDGVAWGSTAGESMRMMEYTAGGTAEKQEDNHLSEWIKTAITILLAFVGSAGFWGFLEARRKKNDANTRLLVGMAHDRIVFLGMKYVERGYITKDEYENLNDYLYEPYAAAGGNGSAKRVMEEVRKIPLHN
nr:MAG TPA: holin protein [Caudoviricetes sp.]